MQLFRVAQGTGLWILPPCDPTQDATIQQNWKAEHFETKRNTFHTILNDHVNTFIRWCCSQNRSEIQRPGVGRRGLNLSATFNAVLQLPKFSILRKRIREKWTEDKT